METNSQLDYCLIHILGSRREGSGVRGCTKQVKMLRALVTVGKS